MAGGSINIEINASGNARGEIEALKAEIAGLTGKSIDINVNVRGGKAALAELGAIAAAREAASGNVKVGADTSGLKEATSHLRDFNAEMGRSGGGRGRAGRPGRDMADDLREARGHAQGLRDDLDRADRTGGGRGGGSTGRLSGEFRDARRAANELESGLSGSRSGMKELESGAESARRPMRALTSGASGGELRGLGRDASRSAIDLHDFGDGVFRTVDAVGRLTGGGGSGGLGGASSMLGGFRNAARGASEALNKVFDNVGPGTATDVIGGYVKGMTALTQVSGYAAIGSGIATAAVGALGVAGVAAFGGVGVAAGAAGVAMSNFAADSLKDSAKFANTFKTIGNQSHLWSQYVSEPAGDAMVSMWHAAQGSALEIAQPIRAGFATAGAVVEAAKGPLIASAVETARAFNQLTGEAAPGVEAFLQNLPSFARSAASALDPIATQFSAGASVIGDSVAPFNRAANAAGGLGAELVRIGQQSLTPFLDDSASMMSHAQSMASGLGPAIRPSMSAFTDLANAAMDAFGSPAMRDGISDFAGKVSKDSPQLQSVMQSLGSGALSLGGALVDGVAQSAPALAELSNSLAQNSPEIAGMIGDFIGAAARAGSFVANVGGWGQRTGDSIISGIDSAVGVTRDASGGIVSGGPSSPHGMTAGPNSGWASWASFAPDSKLSQAVNSGLGAAGLGPRAASVPSAGWSAAVGGAMFSATGGTFHPGLPTTATSGGYTGTAGQGGIFSQPGDMRPMAGMQTSASAISTGLSSVGQLTQGFTQAHQAVSALPMAATQAMGATQSAVANSGVASTTQSQVKSMTKTIDSAGPQVASSGASLGAALGTGVGTGITSTQTVTDTIMRRHISKVIDVGGEAADAHSPSRKTHRLGQWLGQGLQGGIDDHGRWVLGSMSDLMDDTTNMASNPITVTVRRSPLNDAADAIAQPALAGDAKRRAFGEDPNNLNAQRMVYDSRVMSWQTDDISKVGIGPDGKWSGISAPQISPQVGSIQSKLDSADWAPATRERINQLQRDVFDGRDRNIAIGKLLGAGTVDGIAAGVRGGGDGPVQAAGDVSDRVDRHYRRKNGINSPSTVYAGYGGNLMSGLAGGINAGSDTVTAALDGVGQMFSDSGLKVGYVWGQSIVDGSMRVMEKAATKAEGLPSGLSAAAMNELSKTGLIRAGAGAVTWKTAGATPSVVQLVVQLDGSKIYEQQHEIATDAASTVFNTGVLQLAGTVGAQRG